MTPAELRAVLAELRWSWRDLAIQLGTAHTVPQRWRHIPEDVAMWLANLVAAHRANPPPRGHTDTAADGQTEP